MSKYTIQELEESMARNRCKPLGKCEYRGLQIWVGEGWRNDDPKDFPWGYYQGMYMIGKSDERPDIAQEIMFDAMHDPGMPQENRQQARINTLFKGGRKAIDALIKSGFYS